MSTNQLIRVRMLSFGKPMFGKRVFADECRSISYHIRRMSNSLNESLLLEHRSVKSDDVHTLLDRSARFTLIYVS